MENKEEIEKAVKYIFEPIDGSVVSFGKSYDIYCGIRSRGSTESIFSEKNKIVIYPIKINTRLGELDMSLHSTDLNNIKLAIGVSYSYSDFHRKHSVPEDISLEITKRIYLPES
jgi:hypothetical protein